MAPVGGGTLTVGGVVDVPGDKSISHRALILASIASGRSTISGLLCSGDVRSTAEALRSLGIAIGPLAESVTVEGKGFRGLRSPSCEYPATPRLPPFSPHSRRWPVPDL